MLKCEGYGESLVLGSTLYNKMLNQRKSELAINKKKKEIFQELRHGIYEPSTQTNSKYSLLNFMANASSRK